MLKKRIVFNLLYDSGFFVLSRNFRLQKVGGLEWLQHHYNFSHIAFFIDELIVLDVTRGKRNLDAFCSTLQALTSGCFVPISAGGGVRNLECARQLLRSGADKIVINTPLFDDHAFVRNLSEEFGQQCIVASVDVKHETDDKYQIFTENGSRPVRENLRSFLQGLCSNDIVGELYLNSIDRDGTGQGYDFDILDQLPSLFSIPVVLAGGVGNSTHLALGIIDPRIDAVSTAHLFNFLGDGLKQARETILKHSIDLATWAPLSVLSPIDNDPA